MQLQTVSVVVPPLGRCICNCKSCPSKMHTDPYPNFMNPMLPNFDVYLKEYMKRLEFARSSGCNTLMLTGSTEPQQNRVFLIIFGMMMQMVKNPFQWIEMQSTCTAIDADYMHFLRHHVGVSLMSLSTFALDDEFNKECINPPAGKYRKVLDTVRIINECDLALRMSLNMTSYFDQYADDPGRLFSMLKNAYFTDQVTLRVLYATSDPESKESKWVQENAAKSETIEAFKSYVAKNGKLLGILPYGAKKYSICGMSIVIDDDSMGKDVKKKASTDDVHKYGILRQNCRLYSEWDDEASLIF